MVADDGVKAAWYLQNIYFFCVLERITAKIASYIQVSSMQK